jgi:uncharacterized membrane protein YciS (DUF1049 family)
MKFFITKEAILFCAVGMVIMLMITGVVYWRFRFPTEVCKLLDKNDVSADKVAILVLHHYFTQVGNKVTNGKSYEISDKRMIQKILSALKKTSDKSIERNIVFNSELIIYMKNRNEPLRISIVIGRNNEPQYVGLDYGIPDFEFRKRIIWILTNKVVDR